MQGVHQAYLSHTHIISDSIHKLMHQVTHQLCRVAVLRLGLVCCCDCV